MRVSLVVFACVLLGGNTCLTARPSSMAVVFADAFAALGPLLSVYNAYAQYQFTGTPVNVPFDLSATCEQVTSSFAWLRDELACQSASADSAVMTDAAWLALDVEGFCVRHESLLQSLSHTISVSREILDVASGTRLFAAIHAVDDRLQQLMSDVFNGLADGCAVWSFAVTFSMRTILTQITLERIDPSLHAILYGTPDATGPPFAVPVGVEAAMATLVAVQGIDLSEEEADIARAAADVILTYLLSDDATCDAQG